MLLRGKEDAKRAFLVKQDNAKCAFYLASRFWTCQVTLYKAGRIFDQIYEFTYAFIKNTYPNSPGLFLSLEPLKLVGALQQSYMYIKLSEKKHVSLPAAFI